MTAKTHPLTRTAQRAAFAAGLIVGLTIGVPAGPAIVTASAAPHSASIEEDDPAWSCVDDGNRICGPSNTEGKPAGCYDGGGVMVAAWPCFVVVNQAGDADVYTPDAR